MMLNENKNFEYFNRFQIIKDEHIFVAIINSSNLNILNDLHDFVVSGKNNYNIRVRRSQNTTDFFISLLKLLGEKRIPYTYPPFAFIGRCAYRLNKDKTVPKLIVIHDVHKFSSIKFWEFLHILREQTKLTTAIILTLPEYASLYVRYKYSQEFELNLWVA